MSAGGLLPSELKGKRRSKNFFKLPSFIAGAIFGQRDTETAYGSLVHGLSMYCILRLIKVTSALGLAGMSTALNGKIASLNVTT